MIRYYFRKFKKNERGAAMVEFAVVALGFFLLVFYIIEAGWIFNGYISLTSAIREGARQAIVMEVKDESAKNDIKKFVNDQVILFDLPFNDIGVEFGDYEGDTYVEIIDYQIPKLIGLIPLPDVVYVINYKATMRQER